MLEASIDLAPKSTLSQGGGAPNLLVFLRSRPEHHFCSSPRPPTALALLAELRIEALCHNFWSDKSKKRSCEKLKEQAGQHGVSMEEEHRRILREALLGTSKKKPSFKEYLALDAQRGRGQGF